VRTRTPETVPSTTTVSPILPPAWAGVSAPEPDETAGSAASFADGTSTYAPFLVQSPYIGLGTMTRSRPKRSFACSNETSPSSYRSWI